MKKLMFIVATIVASITANAVKYEGENYITKGQAGNKEAYVLPSNVVNVAKKQLDNWLYGFAPSTMSAVNVFNSLLYPSSVHGAFNINLGIDNVTGDPLKSQGVTKYSVTIGTSARAEKMHSYAFGSQINAIGANSTVIGYGVSSTSDWSTVIGHGKRPSTNGTDYDKTFTTEAAMDTWLKKYDANVFPGVHFMNNVDQKLYTITEVSTTPYENGYYYKFVETSTTVIETIPKGTKLPAGTVFYTNTVDGVYVQTSVPAGTTYTAKGTEQIRKSYDYIPGGYDWRYGKSHGPGTFNIVAYHSRWGKTSPGMKAVYINDDCLETLVDTKIKTVAPAAIGPQEMVLDAKQIEESYDNPIKVLSGSTITILPTTNLNSGSELVIEPKDGGLRNYEVYLPNEPEMRAGLPCGFDLSELPEGIRHVYLNGIHMVPTLPAKITVRQPYSRLVIGEITAYDDGWDWNPVITNCNAVWDGNKLTASGSKLFEGYNLQSGTSLKVAYPISGGTIVTNDITKATDISSDGWLSGTFYAYVSGFEFTPPADQVPESSGGAPITFTYIYETKAGKAPATWSYTFDLFAE